eukprot:6384113-Ditylum_brightwellii.AAC.1
MGREETWVMTWIGSILKEMEKEKKIIEEKKQEDGNLPKADIYKMRADEAMFLDEFCDAFFKHYDSLAQDELDAKSSEKKPKTYWEM